MAVLVKALRKRWPKVKRSAQAAICVQRFKPKNMIDSNKMLDR
jgi:hypothetical protein